MKRKNTNGAGLDLFYENTSRAKKLNDDYYAVYDRLVRHIGNQSKDMVNTNILLSHIIENFLESQNKGVAVNTIVGKDFKVYIKKIEKDIDYKGEKKKRRDLDYEKFIISSVWEMFMVMIVLQFVKAWMHENYIIMFSVDVLVAILCFYFGFNNFLNKKKIFNRYDISVKFIYADIFTLIFCLAIVVFIPTGVIDVTLVILVISYLFTKRKVKPLFEKAA